jgi:predicted AAA+ superfamily ATPase
VALRTRDDRAGPDRPALLRESFYESLGKRLIKSAKIYLADPGLACHLLGIDSAAELARSPFAGTLFEGFVASEIVKAQVHSGGRQELYFFRDEQGLEVDFLVPRRAGSVWLVECKASRTVAPADAAPMQRLAEALRRKRRGRVSVELELVHRAPKSGASTRAVAPGVRASAWQDFVHRL